MQHCEIDNRYYLNDDSYQTKLQDIREYGVKPKSVDLVTYRIGFEHYVSQMDEYFSASDTLMNRSCDATSLHDMSSTIIDIYDSIKRRIAEENINIEIDLATCSTENPNDWLRYEYFAPLDYNREPELTRYNCTFYELYGEEKVKRGVYKEVLRQRHLIEIWNSLRNT